MFPHPDKEIVIVACIYNAALQIDHPLTSRELAFGAISPFDLEDMAAIVIAHLIVNGMPHLDGQKIIQPDMLLVSSF